nr:hypothetical protein [Tanacetum cinerariifolium]
QSQTTSIPEQQYQLYLSMKDDPQLHQQDIAIWLALQMKFGILQVPQTTCRTFAICPRNQDDPHDDAHLEVENSANQQKTSEYEAYVFGESSFGQDNEKEQDDDEIPIKQVSQDIMEEVSLTIDEAKLKKITDEMLRQRCTSGDEHQYHIDQMKNFLKSDIVWESRKEILVSSHPRKTTPLVQSCQRDPEAPALSLINQDLLYQKKESSWPEKIVLSLHKFPAVIFNDDDIKERTFRWIFYIRKRKESGKPKGRDLFKLKDYSSYQDKLKSIKCSPSSMSLCMESYTRIAKKKVMRHLEIHKFYDATLNRVLEGLKSYNNDVKYGNIQKDLTKDEAEYLKLFEREIKVRLKYRRQMRRWEMYVNGRPLGPQRERLE